MFQGHYTSPTSWDIKYSLTQQECKRTILNVVYCLDDDFLTIAKDRIGEEKLIKLIKSGV